MDTITVSDITYYLPAKVADVQQLVTQARQLNVEIRVRGSFHSVPAAIFTDAMANGRPCINLMLSKMIAVEINSETNTVVVDGGCHLGYDPSDPTRTSTWENSLFYQLNQAGYAAPDMGGIIHQTVAGFLSTGSSGGSTTYSFNETLQSITFIPANSDHPAPVTVSVTDTDPSAFYAVGVSMGLFGIIVSATFSLVKQYCIQGMETITTIAECVVDLTGTDSTGKTSMRDFLLNTEYTRILWYPQPNVAKATVWQAKQVPYTTENIKPYQELPKILDSNIPAQMGADMIYTAIGQWPNWLAAVMGADNPKYQFIKSFVDVSFYPLILPIILEGFVPLDKKDASGNFISQQFLDYWYSSLPMDNNVSDKLFPVEFTELWIPFADTGAVDTVAQVLEALNQVFEKMYANNSGPIPAGAFATELYAAKPSKFWMSPSNGTQNVFRVDIFWFGNNIGSPKDSFYPLFWEALQPFNFRCHWAKFLPAPGSAQGAGYLQSQYPMWDQFMELRRQYDPNQVFVNDYWRAQLNIPAIQAPEQQ